MGKGIWMRCPQQASREWRDICSRFGQRLLGMGLFLAMIWAGTAIAGTASPAPPSLQVPVRMELLDNDLRAHLSMDGCGVVLPADGRPARFLVRFDLPKRNADGSPWQLRFNRAELKELRLQAPGWQPPAQDFFHPRPHDGLLPMSFEQTLPADWSGPVSIEVLASTDLARTLRPQVVRMALGQEQDKKALAIVVALYASVLVLAIVAVSLFLGARELAFLSFLVFMGATFLLMLVVNGHAYTLPALAWMRPLGAQGLNMSMLLVCASGVAVARDYAGRLPESPWLRWLPVVGAWAMLLLALACLLGFTFGVNTMQKLVTAGWALAALLSFLAFISATLRKTWLGWPLLAALAILGIAGTLFELSVRGIGQPFWGSFGYQIGLVLVSVVLVVALIGRIADFRLKHEKERMARKVGEQRLLQQQAYADLTEILRQRLQEIEPKDLEWYAVQMAMERLLPWLQLESATLILYRPGYDETRITEPVTQTSRLSALIDTNAATLRAVAQRQLPMTELTLNPVPGSSASRALLPPYAAVPLKAGNSGVGVALLERNGTQAFTAEELALAAQFGQLVLQQSAEARATHKLRRSAELDALTGTLNRNAIDRALARAFSDAHREQRSLAVLFVDVDRFKQVNDTYGHACGDHCLKHLADVLRHALRPGDLLGRYGGEEFLVLLPGPEEGQAREVGERIRLQVEESAADWQGQPVKLTVSVGVSTRLPHEQTATATLERADRALYSAKHEGRNRVNHAAQAT